jgi:hypothetical protein
VLVARAHYLLFGAEINDGPLAEIKMELRGKTKL